MLCLLTGTHEEEVKHAAAWPWGEWGPGLYHSYLYGGFSPAQHRLLHREEYLATTTTSGMALYQEGNTKKLCSKYEDIFWIDE